MGIWSQKQKQKQKTGCSQQGAHVPERGSICPVEENGKWMGDDAEFWECERFWRFLVNFIPSLHQDSVADH